MMHFEPRGNRRDNRVRHVYYPQKSGTMVKLEIHHRDGGQNYFSGQTEKRGIEICLSTIDVAPSSAGSTVMMETSTPFDGKNGRLLLLEAARYSAGKLENVVTTLDPIAPDICAAWSRNQTEAIAMITSAMEGSRLAA